MSNIEKIRQEIERRKKENMDVDLPMSIGRYYEDRDILSFIDSLPEEKPEDLEEAAEMAARKIYPYEGGTKGLICENSTPIYKAGYIAGAEWQKEQMMKESVEAKIYGYDDGSFELIASWLDMPNNSIYKDGDKVKIIIVKKKEEEI